MKPRSDHFLISLILVALAVFSLTACRGGGAGKSSPSPTLSEAPSPIARSAPEGATEGGVDGGGGNFVGSEPEQIKAIFHGHNGFDLKETIKSVFRGLEIQVQNKFMDIEAESIFSRMLGPDFGGDPFDVYNDIDASPYELKPEGTCLEDVPGGFKDASTVIDKKQSSICFSLEGLRKLPIQAVPFQLVALAVHEHAHHYGFDETDAMKAQNHVLKMMNQGLLNTAYMEIVGTAGNVRDRATKLMKNLNLADPLICKHVARIDADANKLVDLAAKLENQFETRMLVTALDYQFKLSQSNLTDADELKKLTEKLLAYCGEDPLTNPVWGEKELPGNREKLLETLVKVADSAHRIVFQQGSKPAQ